MIQGARLKHGTYTIICKETEKVVATIVIHEDYGWDQWAKWKDGEDWNPQSLEWYLRGSFNQMPYLFTDENLGVMKVVAEWNEESSHFHQ